MPFDDIRRQGPGRGSYERAINLPPALLWLIVVNVAVHLVRQTLSDVGRPEPGAVARPGPGQLYERAGRRLVVADPGAHHLPVHSRRLGPSRRQHADARRVRRAGRAAAGRAPFSALLSFGRRGRGLHPRAVLSRLGRSGGRRVGRDQRRVRRRADGDAPGRAAAPRCCRWRASGSRSTSSSACSAARPAAAASRSPGPRISAASSMAWWPCASSCRRPRRRLRPKPAATATAKTEATAPASFARMADQPLPFSRYLSANLVVLAPSAHRSRGPVLDRFACRPAGAAGVPRHRRGHHDPGAALSRLAGPLRPLRERAVGRAGAGDAAPVLRAGDRGAGDRGGDARRRLAPPARLDRQSRRLGAGDRRRPARSADRRRPPAPHRAHQPRGACCCSARPCPTATSRPRCAIPSCWPRSIRCWRSADGNYVGPDQVAVDLVLSGAPERDVIGPCPPPAARGGRRLAGADRAARHHGAAPGRAHARRFRRQCQPRAARRRSPASWASSRPCAGRRATMPRRASASSASWPSRPTACAGWSTIS